MSQHTTSHNRLLSILTASSLGLGVITVLFASSAVSAHVVVKPAEVTTASFQTFTVSVPNEKDVANTSIRLVIPDGLKHVTPSIKQGWNITAEKEGTGETAITKSLTWAGNRIPAGFRDDFTFSAQAPASPAELQWKAYQTYEDGKVVSWDIENDKQPKKSDGSPDFSTSGPFSVTKIQAKPVTAMATQDTDARRTADRALYLGVASTVLAFVGIFLATRKDS